jgi:thymidine kinase
MCYGLRTDFQGNLFTGSQALLALADEMREVRTICRCGRKATMVVRLGPDGKVARDGEQVVIGKEAYVSLCRQHWEEEMGRVRPEDLIGFSGT